MKGVEGDANAIGYFGYAYYVENSDKLKAVEIDGGKGCIAPTDATIGDNSYAPLSRPLFIYPNTAKAAANPAVNASPAPIVCDVRRYVNSSRRTAGKASTATTSAPRSASSCVQNAPG